MRPDTAKFTIEVIFFWIRSLVHVSIEATILWFNECADMFLLEQA